MFHQRTASRRKPRAAAVAAAATAVMLAMSGCGSESEGSAQMAQTPTAESSDASSSAVDSSEAASSQDSATETTETTESSSSTSTPPQVTDGGSADTSETTPDAPGGTDSAIPDESSTADSPTTSTSSDAPEADPACLVGDWVITEDELQSYYDTIDAPVEFTLIGDTGLAFTADTYEFTPEFTLKMNIQGMDAEGALAGSVAGSYTADGSILTTSNETNDISLKVQVGAQTIDGAGEFGSLMDAFSINSAPYECGEPGPVLMFETSGTERVPIQLVPQG